MLEVVCSPISGGFFVSQLAIMTVVLESRERSNKIEDTFMDLYFGASGGGLSNILSSYFHKDRESILRVLQFLDSDLFVKNWWKGKTSFIDSKIVSLFGKTFYQEGSGANELFETLERSQRRRDLELWFLTFNIDTDKPVISCTKDKESSNFSELKSEDLEDHLCEDVIFLENNINNIVKTALASASIPVLKDGVEINGNKYVDGGVANTVPYCYFIDSINEKHHSKLFQPPYHYFYILPHKQDVRSEDGSLFAKILKNVLTFNMISDKNNTLNHWLYLIGKHKKDLKFETHQNLKLYDLVEIFDQNHGRNYFCIFYTDTLSVNIADFNRHDVRETFLKACNSIHMEIYID